LRYLTAARRDLLGILDYVAAASDNLETARRFTASLERKCNELASLPGTLGRPRPELRSDLRSTAHGRYVIFFRYVDDVLEIVNILEGHRDIDDYFSDNR
jgi:plasmid stabilization system protein ParE